MSTNPNACGTPGWVTQLLHVIPTIAITIGGLFAHATVSNNLLNNTTNGNPISVTGNANLSQLQASQSRALKREFKVEQKESKKVAKLARGGGWFKPRHQV
jgi:hypothetical protein